MEIISLHLAGSTKCEGQEFIRKEMKNSHMLQPENLYLIRESDNEHDKNAVQVWYEDYNGEKVRLGYIQRSQAPEVAKCMDTGGQVAAIDIAVCGTAETNYGLYFRAQMAYPYEFEIPDLNAHPDDSIYDGRILYYPYDYEMADKYDAGAESYDYGYDIGEEYDGSEEPPYLDEPDIPDDCDWYIERYGKYMGPYDRSA